MYNKQRKLQRAHELANEKRQALKHLGYDVSKISDTALRRVKLSDIKNVSRETLNKQVSRETLNKQVPRKKRKPLTAEQKKKRSDSAKSLHRKKQSLLESLGIPVENLTTTNLRKVKLSDIEKGNINESNYPFLYGKSIHKKFNYDKIYYFPDGKGWYLAWLDYSGETSLTDLILRFNRFSNDTLLNMLIAILSQRPTYKKGSHSSSENSSGRAGDYRSIVTSEKNASFMKSSDNMEIDRNREKKRYHTGVNRYWQNVGDNGKDIITSITGRECLILLNTIFYNITEDQRTGYRGMYNELTRYIPDFKKFLPHPDEFYF